MVFSETRNARAISSVVSPQIVRSVSAICASFGSAGWQQVKIRRRTSSWSAPVFAFGFRKPAADASHRHLRLDLLAFGEKAQIAAQAIDRLVASDIDQPGAGICGHAFARPLDERRREGILHRIFGSSKSPSEPDQRGQHAPASWRNSAIVRMRAARRARGLAQRCRPAAALVVHHDRPHLDRADARRRHASRRCRAPRPGSWHRSDNSRAALHGSRQTGRG